MLPQSEGKRLTIEWKPKTAPEKVFTPRAADINERMYVQRPYLEERLDRALKSTKYIIIHGESGNGKTWLYKKVFTDRSVYFHVLNLSNADSSGSLAGAITSKLGELGVEITTSTQSGISAGAKPWGVGAETLVQTSKSPLPISPFLAYVREIRSRAGNRPAALILDNFEQVVDNDNILREIASVIISADDDAVSASEVKVVIVGTPNDIRSMIARLANTATISNRLTEIPEVARMTKDEAKALMQRGLKEEIGLSFDLDEEALYEEICWKTDRIAQHIHELCLNIAYEAIRIGGVVNRTVVNEAEQQWAEESLSADWATIDGVMNARETRAGRKNQVIYCIGKCESEDFTYADIEKILRKEFPLGTQGVILNIVQILAGFAGQDNPLIRRTPNGTAYRLVSPKFRMAIRTRLSKTADERVEKVF